MNKNYALAAVLLVFGAGLTGCSNAAEGAKEDAANNTAAVKDAADTAATKTVEGTKAAGAKIEGAAAGAVDATKEAGAAAVDATKDAANKVADTTKDAADKAAAVTAGATKQAGDALGLTPTVKNAILDVPELKDPAIAKNINVDTSGDVVHLVGEVPSNDLKKKAGAAATKAVKDAGSSNTVSNELKVTKH